LFGTQAVLMRRFMPKDALSLIARFRANIMYGVPTMFMYMLSVPESFDTSSMRMWVVGAAAMPTDQLMRFEQRFGGTVYVGYGLTEASPSVAVDREFEPRKPGSTGKPLEGVSVKIVDATGRTLPAGQIGEICASGANISKGYLGLPDATAQTFRDGWLYTGDLGYLDQDGYLFVVDRKKDLIIRAGLNVYPADVEEVLYAHPAVRECAVIGIPDVELGERVCACVVLRDGMNASEEELIAHCQARLAKYKTPARIEFMHELPRTAIGKILKKDLRAQVAAKLDAEPEAATGAGAIADSASA
jgi:long-chain acyl-CoA synthetase